MSLYDAIEDIVKDMEIEEPVTITVGGSIDLNTLKSYAKQLRRAMKAAGNEPGPLPAAHLANPYGLPQQSAEIQHVRAIDEARKEFRKSKLQEEGDIRSCLLVGGPGDGAHVPVSAEMPVGARTGVFNSVYEMKEDQKMHFVGGADEAPKEQRLVLG